MTRICGVTRIMIDPKFFGSSTSKGFFLRSMVVTEGEGRKIAQTYRPNTDLVGGEGGNTLIWYGLDQIGATRFELGFYIYIFLG